MSLATALRGITDGLITLDHDWRCTYANEAAATFFRTTLDQMTGKIVWKVFPPLRDSRFHAEFTRAAREKVSVKVEDYHEPLGRWCECRCYPTEKGLTVFLCDTTGNKRIEEAMLESRQALEMAIEDSSAGIWRVDLDPERPGTMPDYVYLSPQLKALIGFGSGEFPNSRSAWFDQIVPEDRPRLEEAARAHVEGRTERYEVEYRIRHKDGGLRWLNSRGRLYRDEFDRPARWAGVDTDITERKRAEEDLLRFKEQAERAAEQANREHRETAFANRVLRAFVEYEGDELFDRALAVVQEEMASRHGVFGYIPEPGHLICPSLSKMLDACEIEEKCIHYPPEKWKGLWARALTEKRSFYTNEAPPVPPGHPIIHNNLAAPILFRGEAIGLLNLANKEGGYDEEDRDTLDAIAARVAPVLYAWIQRRLRADERKEAQEEVQRLARQRQLALDAARLGWWHYDPITRVASWDDGYKEIFGVTDYERPVDEILAKVIHPDDLPGLWARVEAALNPVDPRPFAAEYRINRSDGQTRWIEAHGIVSFDGAEGDRRATSFVGTVADITERKEAEEALAAGERRYREVIERLAQEKKTLAESEQRYRTMGESVDYGVWAADAEGKAIYISPSFCEMVGRTFEEIQEFGWLDRLVPEQRDEVLTLWMHSVRTGDPFEHEHHFIDREGNVRIVLARGRPVRGEKGRIVSWAGINLDISERKRMEQDLRESEQRLRLALEGGRMGLWEWDLETDRSYWDERLRQLLGMDPGGQVSHKQFARHVDPRDVEPLRARVEKSLADGSDFQAEFRLIRQSGEIIWVASQGKVIRDSSGKPVRMLGVLFDVTPRKQMEGDLRRLNDQLEKEVLAQTEELRDTVDRLQDEVVRRVLAEGKLRKSAQMLEGFFQHTITPLAFMDRRFNFVQVNEAYAQADGRAPEFFKGRNHFDLYPHDENRAIFEQVVQTGRLFRAHARPFCYPDRPQQITYWDWQLTPLHNERGEVQYLVLNLQDVTQQQAALRELEHRAHQLQKLTLELSQAEDRERRRMAEVLHDGLQQQLAAAKFHLGLLSSRAGNDAAMQEIAMQLDSMLREAIEQSRSLSHELSPAVLYQSDLGETFEWLARQVRTKHGLTIHTEIHGRVDSSSESIKAFLFRTGQEILFNTVKHARVQEARLRLQRKGERLWLTIADQGRGFDPATLGRTTGFGLLSIRERVGLLGGRMRIRSAPGKGSTFLIAVPDAQAVEVAQPPIGPRRAATGTPPAAGRRPATSGGRLRVLLVDDHKVMREGLAALISEQKDMEIVGQAGDGSEAVELARALEPDVIIMDVAMPVTPGDEATRQIKSELPETRIVALSMFAEPGVREKMLDAGAEAYLAKTGPSDEFLAAIRGPAARE